MSSLQSLSERLYEGLSDVVGTSKQVSIRRDIMDVGEITRDMATSSCTKFMISGSFKEGFRLCGSDIDIMYWNRYYKVLHDFSQSSYYNTRKNILILMENDDTKPGFTLLRLLSRLSKTDKFFKSSCVILNEGLYISSTLYKQSLISDSFSCFSIHGPCANVNFFSKEREIAISFQCDFWPPVAYPWIHRAHTWPPPSVLQDIVRSGCHFVAIGSRGSQYENIEWRISFSLAEQKLVYSMNHTQFLVYGLLKLFLKEVINEGVTDKLLCSYYMKSVVFWQIQATTNHVWCPQNLLVYFWNCLKQVIQWVYTGICPNFFIPENNMFSNKVVGQAQKCLFLQLNRLYEQGISCLLQCKSIRSYFIGTLYHCTTTNHIQNFMTREINRDKTLWSEINKITVHTSMNFSLNNLKFFEIVKHKMHTLLKQHQLVYLHMFATSLLQQTAFYLLNMNIGHNLPNKMMYITDRASRYMLHRAARFGCISDLLILAMYYYRTFRYEKATCFIEMTKVKIAQPYFVWSTNTSENVLSYNETVGGKSWLTKMRETVAMNCYLHKDLTYIRELELEQNTLYLGQSIDLSVRIPFIVMLHMLSVLCYNHTDTAERKEALNDLYVFLHHFAKLCLTNGKAILWQILGICQEACHDWQGAINSYQESLKHDDFDMIKWATYIRIKHAVTKLASA